MAEPQEPQEERNVFANYDPSVRGRIVGMHQAGCNNQEIQAAIECNIKTVRLWINEFIAGGDRFLRNHQKNNRRPLKTTPEEDVQLCQAVEERPFTTISATLHEIDIGVSVSTARRRLRDLQHIVQKKGLH